MPTQPTNDSLGPDIDPSINVTKPDNPTRGQEEDYKNGLR